MYIMCDIFRRIFIQLETLVDDLQLILMGKLFDPGLNPAIAYITKRTSNVRPYFNLHRKTLLYTATTSSTLYDFPPQLARTILSTSAILYWRKCSMVLYSASVMIRS